MIGKKIAMIGAALIMALILSGVVVYAQTTEASKKFTMDSIDGKALIKIDEETTKVVIASLSVKADFWKAFKKVYAFNVTEGTLKIDEKQYQITDGKIAIGKELYNIVGKLNIRGPESTEFTFLFKGELVYHANGHAYYVIKGLLRNIDGTTRIGASFLMQASR